MAPVTRDRSKRSGGDPESSETQPARSRSASRKEGSKKARRSAEEVASAPQDPTRTTDGHQIDNDDQPKKNSHNDNLPEDLTSQAFDHYRRYMQSCGDFLDLDEDVPGHEDGADPEGDLDELQALLDLCCSDANKSKVTPVSVPSNLMVHGQVDHDLMKDILQQVTACRTALLPVLVSISATALADEAIAKLAVYFDRTNTEAGPDEAAPDRPTTLALIQEQETKVHEYLRVALEYFPLNAATWSMGANYGHMFARLSLAQATAWYEHAAPLARAVRQHTMELLATIGKDRPTASKESADHGENDKGDDDLAEWIEMTLMNQVAVVDQVEEDGEEDDDDGQPVSEESEEGTMKRKATDKKENKNLKKEEANLQDYDGGDDDRLVKENIVAWTCSAVESTTRCLAAMLLSTTNQHDRALEHLKRFPITHRLHPHVWNGQPAQTSDHMPTKQEPVLFRCGTQGVVPAPLYQRLCQVFAPEAVYWKESAYASRGYYSFFMDLPATTSTPSNLIEEIVCRHLLPLAQKRLPDQKATEASPSVICGYEWWVHTRPIKANLGHHMHFDTDEALLSQEGEVSHPIVSMVLYLTGCQGQAAGATIVLDQTPDSEQVASKAWRNAPVNNTALAFPGNLLHGVLPCPGTESMNHADQASQAPPLLDDLNSSQPLDPWAQSADDYRLSFMVGFWTRRVPDKMENRKLYGPCGPLPPRNNEEHTWVEHIHEGYSDGATQDGSTPPPNQSALKAEAVPYVEPAWEVIAELQDQPQNDDDDPPLEIPKALDHRFFVRDAPQCFRDVLFERDDDEYDDDDVILVVNEEDLEDEEGEGDE